MTESLKLERREALGKSSVKKLRLEGYVPAVVYGKEKETALVQLDANVLKKYFEEGGRMADVTLDGKKLKALVKEIQHDALSDDILHVDFQLVSLTEKITLPVTVVLTGELSFPPDQGILEQVLTDVDVECLPDDAPEELKVDISGLEPDGSIHVSELELPSGVVMVTPAEEVLATVRRPVAEEEEAPAEEAEEALEPEVIGEKKEETEEPKQ